MKIIAFDYKDYNEILEEAISFMTGKAEKWQAVFATGEILKNISGEIEKLNNIRMYNCNYNVLYLLTDQLRRHFFIEIQYPEPEKTLLYNYAYVFSK
jgi:hypothetical protein